MLVLIEGCDKAGQEEGFFRMHGIFQDQASVLPYLHSTFPTTTPKETWFDGSNHSQIVTLPIWRIGYKLECPNHHLRFKNVTFHGDAFSTTTSTHSHTNPLHPVNKKKS